MLTPSADENRNINKLYLIDSKKTAVLVITYWHLFGTSEFLRYARRLLLSNL